MKQAEHEPVQTKSRPQNVRPDDVDVDLDVLDQFAGEQGPEPDTSCDDPDSLEQSAETSQAKLTKR